MSPDRTFAEWKSSFMQNTTESTAASSSSAGLGRLLTPNTKIAVGAWLLCMTGVVALINPSDLPASAFFRLSLAGMGFALYAWGRTDKQRQQAMSETQFLNGLSGWLILLAAMLWVTLLGAVLQAISDVPQIIRGNPWADFTTPGRAAYHPLWAMLLVLDWGSNLFSLVLFPVLLTLFFQRKRAFPTIMFWTLLVFVVLVTLRFSVADRISFIKGDGIAMPLVLAVLKAAVWIPYLRLSKRVRVTFVN
jgi:hypothetical protein